jgi:ceramide glucosyltransferase
MSKTDLILSIAAAVSVLTSLLGIVAVWWVTRRPRSVPDHTPPVTIFKPLKGLDEDLESNLRSFFELDYPVYQLLFGVADPDDPAVDVVRRLIAAFPDRDASLVVGNPVFGLNPKVENLAAMERLRKHDVILISDSNVRARPSYLRETACYLADPSVGLVTNLFAGEGEERLGAILENLQLNGFIAGGMAGAAVLGITCVVGKSMLMPARVLAEIGGFAGVRNLLAEDQVLGLRVRKAGYRIVMSPHVITNVNRRRNLGWFLNRHSRWYKIRLRLAPGAFAIEPIANLTSLGLIWALSGDSGFAWGGLIGLAGLGVVRDAIQTKRLRGTFPKLRDLPLCLVKDLFLLPAWFDAALSRRVNWRGHRFLIGRLTRLRLARPGRDARKRVRRLRRLRDRRIAEG